MNYFSSIIATIAIGLSVIAIVVAMGSGVVPPQLGGYTSGDWEAADDLIAGDDLTVAGLATIGETLTVTGESNLDTLVQGGDVIWVYGTTTLTAAQVCNSSVINIGLLADAMMSLTLPTTATLVADCLMTVGDHKSLLIRDAATSTLAATILAGTGIDLEGDDTNADVLAADASVELELYVATSTDTLVGVLRPFTNAD